MKKQKKVSLKKVERMGLRDSLRLYREAKKVLKQAAKGR